jgi:hypothetical protein
MTATPIPGYTIDKVQNALHSTGGINQLIFIHGSVFKLYTFTVKFVCEKYRKASCKFFTAV